MKTFSSMGEPKRFSAQRTFFLLLLGGELWRTLSQQVRMHSLLPVMALAVS
jgi:hypothetical protein